MSDRIYTMINVLDEVAHKFELDETDLRIIGSVLYLEEENGVGASKSYIATCRGDLSPATIYNRLNKKLIPKKFVRETKSEHDGRGKILSGGSKTQELCAYINKL